MKKYKLKIVEDFDWQDLMSLEWGQGEHTKLLPNTAGKDNIPPSMFMLLKSSTRLYFKFVTIDKDPKSTMTEYNAPLYDEEPLEIFISPDGNLERYFEFEVNHLGAVFAAWANFKDGKVQKLDFVENNPVKVKIAPTHKGFITYGYIDITDWNILESARINVYRIKRDENNDFILGAYSPTGVDNFHVPDRFAGVEFIPS